MKPTLLVLMMAFGACCRAQIPTEAETEAALSLHRSFLAQSTQVYNRSDKFKVPSALWSDSYGNGLPTIIVRDVSFSAEKKSAAIEAMQKAMSLANIPKAALVFVEIVNRNGVSADGAPEEHVISASSQTNGVAPIVVNPSPEASAPR